MKRYAIVRVDDSCPSGHDGCKVNLVCVQDRNNIKEKWCKNCLYGDTKEQLARKIAQVIERKLKGGLILRNTKINETYNIQKAISAKDVAKEIVEFLGVEE